VSGVVDDRRRSLDAILWLPIWQNHSFNINTEQIMATAVESPVAPADASVLGNVLSNLDQVHHAADEILWRLTPGELPNAREREILKLAGIVDRDDLGMEVGRVTRVRRLIAEAGSKNEHSAASSAAAAAVRNDREKRPALEKQLAEIQSQIDVLVQTRDAATEKLGGFNRARDQLRELPVLPGYIRDAYEADVHVAGQTHVARISELERELSVIGGLERIDLSTTAGRREAELHCETAQPNLIQREEHLHPANVRHKPDGTVFDSRGVCSVKFDTGGFQRYREQRIKERPKLQRELYALNEERAAAIAKVNRLLEHWIERIE
jgi:hypothetical protein